MFSAALPAAALSRTAAVADLTTMCEAMRVTYQRLNRNRRGGKFLDYTMAAGHLAITTILVLASAGVKLPGV